eukprot:TRINITY_DN19969_c0_g1_i1.p1 TRINITY_DN19969_c0_g1~~TRINITY_DN19969_c0_g1_i1.p1  ORF type:complete len:334 (-),score=99.93 TRINITY_DN19969_c0_g1_i1:36-1037(-)
MATRWGIVGAGKISHDFLTAMGTLPIGDHRVVAVAARDRERAMEFGKTHKVEKVLNSYEELAKDVEVEVVYVGVIAPAHREMVKLMLTNEKAVLCEKPLGLSLAEVTEMVELARQKNVFFMEAVWSRTFPLYDALTERLSSLGQPCNMVLTFGQAGNHLPDQRLAWKKNGGGTVLDWGVYCIQMVLHVFGPEMPSRVVASGLELNEDGVDVAMSVALYFSGSRMATFITDLRVDLPCEAHISSSGGQVKVAAPFWCPPSIEVNGVKEDFPLPSGAKHSFHFVNSQGLAFEAAEVRRCLKLGLKESPKMSLETTMIIAQVQQEIMNQLGIDYKA